MVTCNQVLDEGEDGEILCSHFAGNRCRKCLLMFCDEHFNHLMGLCDDDSEVEAAEHI